MTPVFRHWFRSHLLLLAAALLFAALLAGVLARPAHGDVTVVEKTVSEGLGGFGNSTFGSNET